MIHLFKTMTKVSKRIFSRTARNASDALRASFGHCFETASKIAKRARKTLPIRLLETVVKFAIYGVALIVGLVTLMFVIGAIWLAAFIIRLYLNLFPP